MLTIRRNMLEECGSTNTEARDSTRYSHGDAVVALRQTAGRGQRGHAWDSAPGENLTFSLVVEPVFLYAAEQFMLSKTAALAVADTLSHYGLDPRIKWTNDVYVGDRKICGMLLENDLREGRIARTIAGIGLNVNQTNFPEWIPNPTSLALETDRRHDIMDVFEVLAEKFAGRYGALENGGADEISADYNTLLFRRDEPHKYFIPCRGEVVGIIRGVENDGALVVVIGGETERFLFKEIEFIIGE